MTIKGEQIPFPVYIALGFVCIDVSGYGCASKGAWNAQATPYKHKNAEPWINPFAFFGSGADGLRMVDASHDDAVFCVKMLEQCKPRARQPAIPVATG